MAAGYGDPSSNSPVKIGSVVSCVTVFDTVVKGEVLSFEPQTKLLALREMAGRESNEQATGNGKRGKFDVTLVNLNYVSDVTIAQETVQPLKELLPISVEKLKKREEEQTQNKKMQAELLEKGIHPEAHRLFLSIKKTFDCEWRDRTIVVAKDIRINPPYRPEDCEGNPKGLDHIRKLVEKYYREQRNGSA